MSPGLGCHLLKNAVVMGEATKVTPFGLFTFFFFFFVSHKTENQTKKERKETHKMHFH
jgi:hypothetical protein